MKKITTRNLMIGLGIVASLTFVGCENGTSETRGNAANSSNINFDANAYPESTLTQGVKDALAYMGNEERLAYDVYMNLYDYHIANGIEIKQLLNISQNAEAKHIDIVQQLVRKYQLAEDELSDVSEPVADNTVAQSDMPRGVYDIAKIQELYDDLYAKGIDSKQDALEVGCMVEVVDVTDLDAYIQLAQTSEATDVVDAFNILREGSYHHYWAFDKGLKKNGVTDGCCTWSELCHPEYPQKEKGKDGEGKGKK